MVFRYGRRYSAAAILREGVLEEWKFRVRVYAESTSSLIPWVFDRRTAMNLKLIVTAVLAGGVLMFFGIKPGVLLDQGGNVWGKFSGDLWAVFNGDAKDRLAKEIKGSSGNDARAIHETIPAAAGDEISTIAHDINRDRKEAAKTVKVIDMSTEELKRRIEDQQKQLE